MARRADSVHFWRSIDWPGIELMTAHLIGQRFVRHFHDAYTIGVNERGAGVFDCRRQPRDAQPGTLNLIEPGEVHTGHATAREGWGYRNFYIEPNAMQTLFHLAGFCGLPEFPASVVLDGEAVEALSAAFDSLTDTEATRLKQEFRLIVAIRRLQRHSRVLGREEDSVEGSRQIGRVLRDYLDAHATRQVSLRELAAVADRSPYHVIRIVQAETGLPPHAYQSTVRVNRARKLLQHGMPIADVAVACGFYDQSHLYRVFHRTQGLPPGQYQQPAISSKTLP